MRHTLRVCWANEARERESASKATTVSRLFIDSLSTSSPRKVYPSDLLEARYALIDKRCHRQLLLCWHDSHGAQWRLGRFKISHHSGSVMNFPRRPFLRLAMGATALPVVSRIAWAQAYPSRP